MEALQSTLTQKKYHYYTDFIRVFSIIMVITLHCINDYYNNISNIGKKLWVVLSFTNELCRTGVPLFFMVSGFLLLSSDISDIKTFYKRRFMKIGIPFLLYDIFYYLFFSYINKTEISIVTFFKELTNCGSSYHLWFIYSILFLYLLIPFAKIIIDACSPKKIMLLFILAIFQTTIRPFINTISNGYIYIFLTDDAMFGYFGYMLLGYILGTYKIKPLTEYLIYIIGIIFFITTPIFSMHNATVNGSYLFHGGYSINHYAEAAAIFVLCKNKRNNACKLVPKVSSLTFAAYFIHVFILEILKIMQYDTTPSVQIAIYMVLTIPLSFFWAIIEKKLFKNPLKVSVNHSS